MSAVLLSALSMVIGAQTSQNKQPKQTSSKSKLVKTEELDPLIAERRNVAVSLLSALADDARGFRDQKLRARVLARAADALWTTEPDRSRGLHMAARSHCSRARTRA